MSKWGYVSEDSAKAKFENDPDEAAGMVMEMAEHIINCEDEISSQQNQIITLQKQIMALNLEVGHSRGYIDRVRELDKTRQDFSGRPPTTRDLIDRVLREWDR